MVDAEREPHDLEPRDLADGLFEAGPDDLDAVVRLHRHARWVADYYPVDSVTELDDGTLRPGSGSATRGGWSVWRCA